VTTDNNELLACPFCGAHGDDISSGEALLEKDGKYHKQKRAMTDNNAKNKRQLSEAQIEQRRNAGKSSKGKKKSQYTMSDAAVAQRQAAAEKSTGPVTDDGKAASSRNAWKTGLYSRASSLIKQNWAVGAFAKPCRTTCQYHPENPHHEPAHACTLVLEGYTKAGGDCLDKTVYVQAFDGILQTLAEGKADAMHGILAAEAAGALEVLQRLREEIGERGFVIWVPITDKEGNKLGEKPISNPALPHYIKMLESLGINLPELLATPRAVKAVGEQEDQQNALASLLGHALGNVANGRRGRTFEG
jgi:hypothetical protein